MEIIYIIHMYFISAGKIHTNITKHCSFFVRHLSIIWGKFHSSTHFINSPLYSIYSNKYIIVSNTATIKREIHFEANPLMWRTTVAVSRVGCLVSWGDSHHLCDIGMMPCCDPLLVPSHLL